MDQAAYTSPTVGVGVAGRVLAWVESVGLFAALYVGLPVSGLVLDGWLGWPPLPAILRAVGGILLAVGAGGIAWCFLLFVRIGRGTPNPWDPPQVLVTAGPFAWTRNPIILSHALAALGVSLIVASLSAVVLVLLLGVAVQFIVRREERTLEARYGDAYRQYRDAVPRWIPRRPRHTR